jgi:hypothetical protein
MKKIILLIALCTVISISLKAQKKPKEITLTVTFIHREEGLNEVWAKSKRYLYMAICPFIPDSIRLGTVLKADPYKNQKDCTCLFKRVK